MLIAKLKTPVEKIYQGPGISVIKVACDYITVAVENYEMNSPSTHFYYKIGKIEFNEDGGVKKWDAILKGYVDLSAKELVDWGTDDYIAIKAVATKLGIELDEDVRIDAKELKFQA